MTKMEKALIACEKVVEGIEDETISTSSAMLQCSKIARLTNDEESLIWLQYEYGGYPRDKEGKVLSEACNGVQREHNKKLNNGLPILHKVPPKRDYGRYFCIMAEKGGTSHGGLTEKLSPFFHAKKQEVNAYGR